jgi:hypothetical protein
MVAEDGELIMLSSILDTASVRDVTTVNPSAVCWHGVWCRTIEVHVDGLP